jgi:hypothetical protein
VVVAIVIVAVIVIAVLIWYILRQRQQQQAPDRLESANVARSKRASAQGLKLGDVVNFEGHDLVVQGSIHYNQSGSTWDEHLLVDGTYKRWLSVEDDEGLEIAVWEKLVDPDLTPGDKRIQYGGKTYVMEEDGKADFTAEGSTGLGASGRYEYFDYEAGDARLSFERYGGDAAWELSTGHVIPEGALDVYPASEPPS